MIKSLWTQVYFVQLMEKSFISSQRTHGLVIWEPHDIQLTMTQALLMLPVSMSWYKEVQVICLPIKRANSI